MKPAPFAYHVPASLEEALALLQSHGEAARVLAGGQSLVPMMNFRLAQPEQLVDITRLPGLNQVRTEGAQLRVGALTTLRRLERDPAVAAGWPILLAALGHVGHVPVRNRGTVGGSLAHADPAAELATVLLALGGSIVCASPQGGRELPVAAFLVGPYETALREGELVTEMRVPALPAESGWAFVEFSRRHGDFALVCVAAWLSRDAAGGCRAVGIALGGVAGTPVRAQAAERILLGQAPTAERIAEAAATAAELVTLESEYHASRAYRTHLATVCLQRALTQAVGTA